MEYRPYHLETDLKTHCRTIAEAFATEEVKIEQWLQKLGPENIRIMEHDGEYAGTCAMISMGQFFGGRSVSMYGVAGVAVRPQFRGAGVGYQMMAEMVREMAATGASISTLYPSTVHLYRKVGYGLAGIWPELEMGFDQLPEVRASLRTRPMQDGDQERIAKLYREQLAPTRPGYLDRGKYIWDRVFQPRGASTFSYVFENDCGELRAFVSLQQETPPELDMWQKITVTGMDAVDAEAWASILAHLRSYTPMARQLVLPVGPGHPILPLFREQRWKQRIQEVWMTRILNLKSALESRGYAAQLRGSLLLQVSDDLLPQNHGLFALNVENGTACCQILDQASAEIDPERLIQLDVRQLSPLYTGYMSAEQLAQSGGIQATPTALQVATALFQGTMPSCPEMF